MGELWEREVGLARNGDRRRGAESGREKIWTGRGERKSDKKRLPESEEDQRDLLNREAPARESKEVVF